jgi:hypothetical protein
MSSLYFNQPFLLRTTVSILSLVKGRQKSESVTNMFPQGAVQDPSLLVNCKCDVSCPGSVGILFPQTAHSTQGGQWEHTGHKPRRGLHVVFTAWGG